MSAHTTDRKRMESRLKAEWEMFCCYGEFAYGCGPVRAHVDPANVCVVEGDMLLCAEQVG